MLHFQQYHAPDIASSSFRPCGVQISRARASAYKSVNREEGFCAVTELATALPVDIASAVGLPEEGRDRMLVWAEQMFDCFGPLNDRSRAAFPVLQEMMHYAATQRFVAS